MALSDREAAELRKEDAVAKAYQTLAQHKGSSRHQPAMGFRNGLIEAVGQLRRDLIDLYSELDGAGEEPLRSELAAMISDRLSAFIQSCVAGVHGTNSAGAARTGARLISSSTVGVDRDMDLAVRARLKQHRQVPTPSTPTMMPVRKKQDKFEILDSPRQYESDFAPSVGLLGVSIIYFDLDDFKRLNNRFTEPVIDKTLLPELQNMIAALIDQRGYAYAEGGDEFIVMLPNTNTALAEAFASSLLERVRATMFVIGEERVKVTASAGIASSMNPDDAQACRESASAAKRDAKQGGKDRYVVSPLRT
jgi:diguanylate cyclase (GGDEF)-like protein